MDPVETLRAQHRALDELLRAHLDAVIALDFAAALSRLAVWQHAFALHLHAEDLALIPALADVVAPRWVAHVYDAEHRHLEALVRDYAGRFAGVVAALPDGVAKRRNMALAIIDSAHVLRHVIDHHHQREEQALFLELPAAVLARAAHAGSVEDAAAGGD
ncbi:MAG: hypothetical protein KGJ50_03650 [Xanthomonadaceae bacterium]|nr:hypothetical protein [Xanthomonadaceae bacterium]